MSFEHCRHCVPPERHPGCHSHCPHYAADLKVERAKREYLEFHVADKYTIANAEKVSNVKQIQQRNFKQKCGKGAGRK